MGSGPNAGEERIASPLISYLRSSAFQQALEVADPAPNMESTIILSVRLE